jgi:hypothetical protein
MLRSLHMTCTDAGKFFEPEFAYARFEPRFESL